MIFSIITLVAHITAITILGINTPWYVSVSVGLILFGWWSTNLALTAFLNDLWDEIDLISYKERQNNDQ